MLVSIVSVFSLIVIGFIGGYLMVGEVRSSSDTSYSRLEPEIWEVKHEHIGRSFTFVGKVDVNSMPSPQLRQSGTITAVHLHGTQELGTNTRIVDVDLVPVVAGVGDMPLFRELGEGDQGADVAQLRSFLCGLGYGVCGSSTFFDENMTLAVKKWQKKLNAPVTGRVSAGAIMFFPSLPVTASLKDGIAVGEQIEETSRVLSIAGKIPTVSIKLSEEQKKLVSPGSSVLFDDGAHGVLGEFSEVESSDEEHEQAGYLAEVFTAEGEPYCSTTQYCSVKLDGKEKVNIELKVESVAESDGLGVPLMAVQTDATGKTYVVLETGEHQDIQIEASDGAIALVSGLSEGTRVRLRVVEDAL